MSINQVLNRIKVLEDRNNTYKYKAYQASLKDNKKVSSLGWGSGMRGYKCMSMRLDSDQKWIDKIKTNNDEIERLKKLLK